MSQLSKSLEKRIQELAASIESHKTELAAYERVLHMELSNENTPAENGSVETEIQLPVSKRKKSMSKAAASKKSTQKPVKKGTGTNKTMMVAEIVQGFGTAGASPKEVDAALTEKEIPRSKNLVYNTLSYLVAHNRLVRREGKYFPKRGRAMPANNKAGAKKSGPKKALTTKKRHLSPEGLKRIKDALKKRWAAKKAAQAEQTTAAETKTVAKKKQA